MTTRAEIRRLVPAPEALQPVILEASDGTKSLTIGDTAFVVWDAALPNGRSFGNLAACSPQEAEAILKGNRSDFSRVQWPLTYVAQPGDLLIVPNYSHPEEAGNTEELIRLNRTLRSKLLEVVQVIVRA